MSRRLDARDRDVLLVWAAFVVALWTLAGAVGWMVADAGAAVPALGWAQRWGRWDFVHFQGIALYGYAGSPTGVPNEAFFPGLPLLLKVGIGAGLPGVVAGAVVSALAGGVAAVALGRLGRSLLPAGGGRGAARRDAGLLPVVLWLGAPSAVFLVAPYTESLFLALSLPAWLAARSGRWALAGLLAAGACTVRVSGVFLVVALAVAWAVGTDPEAPRPRRRPGDLAWLVLPVAVLVAWTVYLRVQTGDWLAWLHAQEQEWNRGLTAPWDAALHTWQAATGSLAQADFTWMFRVELVAMLAGLVGTLVLLARRRWAEATWVAQQVAAFGTSYWFFSVPRATLLWWPLWLLLAGLLRPRPRAQLAYLAVSAPLAAVVAVAYLTGRWAG